MIPKPYCCDGQVRIFTPVCQQVQWRWGSGGDLLGCVHSRVGVRESGAAGMGYPMPVTSWCMCERRPSDSNALITRSHGVQCTPESGMASAGGTDGLPCAQKEARVEA